jgi:very-short-patch-repair endonuclease
LRVSEIARSQWSQITTRQLKQVGLSLREIRGAVQRGFLFHAFYGVYSIGRPISSPHERAMAAVLACGPGALLSHHWALWNYDLARLPDHDPDVTVATSRHARPGITVHRTRNPPAHDHNHGIPTTSPNRSIIDAAPRLPSARLRRVVNQAQILRLTTAESLRGETLNMRGVSTSALLGELPEDQHGATRSLLEDLLLDLHRDRGLPEPTVNATVDGREVDFSYPALRLIIEADGWDTHRTRIAFEADRATRLALEAAGHRVVAVTYRQLTREYARTAGQLEAVIRASASSSPR